MSAGRVIAAMSVVGFLTVAAAVGALVMPSLRGLLAIDVCIDRGGNWDPDTSSCDPPNKRGRSP